MTETNIEMTKPEDSAITSFEDLNIEYKILTALDRKSVV